MCPLHTKCVPAPRIVIRHPGSRHLPEGGNVPHHKSICSEVGGLEGCRRNAKKIAITPSVQTHHKQDCEPLGVLGCFKPGSHYGQCREDLPTQRWRSRKAIFLWHCDRRRSPVCICSILTTRPSERDRDAVFKGVIKVKRGHWGGSLIHCDWCPYKKRRSGLRHTHRGTSTWGQGGEASGGASLSTTGSGTPASSSWCLWQRLSWQRQASGESSRLGQILGDTAPLGQHWTDGIRWSEVWLSLLSPKSQRKGMECKVASRASSCNLCVPSLGTWPQGQKTGTRRGHSHLTVSSGNLDTKSYWQRSTHFKQKQPFHVAQGLPLWLWARKQNKK